MVCTLEKSKVCGGFRHDVGWGILCGSNLLACHCKVLDVYTFTMNAEVLEIRITWVLFLLFVSSTFPTFASLFLSFGFV